MSKIDRLGTSLPRAPAAAAPAPASAGAAAGAAPQLVEVSNMTFAYTGDCTSTPEPVLRDVSLSIGRGERIVLVGGNGAGKSTFLRLLAGRHITRRDSDVRIKGRHSFRDTSQLQGVRSLVENGWGAKTVSFAGNTMLTADIAVGEMSSYLQNAFPERRAELIQVLGVNLEWRMHKLSDGQRRRVQLFLGLLQPVELLLLDEVSSVLDVLCRRRLHAYLLKESEERGMSIVFASHIFDGLDDWASRVVCLTHGGRVGFDGTLAQMPNSQTSFLAAVLDWLDADAQAAPQEDLEEKESGVGAHGSTNTGNNIESVQGLAPGRMNLFF